MAIAFMPMKNHTKSDMDGWVKSGAGINHAPDLDIGIF